MADIFSALIGAAPNQQDKQAAIADILRRKGAFGLVGQLTGDPVLSSAGQNMQQESMQMAQMAQKGAAADRDFAFDQSKQAAAHANAQTGFDLQRQQMDIQRRGQDLDYAAALERAAAAKDAATQRANKLTDTQAAAKAYLGRMQAAEQRMSTDAYTPDASDFVAGEYLYGGKGPLSSVLANQFLSKEGKQYFQSASDWVRAKLRKESGAVISPAEMASEIRTYFPVPGDDQAAIDQKAVARKEAEKQLLQMSGQTPKAAPVKVNWDGTPRGD